MFFLGGGGSFIYFLPNSHLLDHFRQQKARCGLKLHSVCSASSAGTSSRGNLYCFHYLAFHFFILVRRRNLKVSQMITGQTLQCFCHMSFWSVFEQTTNRMRTLATVRPFQNEFCYHHHSQHSLSHPSHDNVSSLHTFETWTLSWTQWGETISFDLFLEAIFHHRVAI